MVFLAVGVQPDRKAESSLDHAVYFGLLHSIGKKFRQIGRLNVFQRNDLLWRAEAGGAIRWYSFWTEGASGPSIPWTGCVNEYWVSVGLVEPDPGVSAVVLDRDVFCQLVEDFSIDLEKLRKLERYRVADIFRRLTALEYVSNFVVEKEVIEHDFPGYSNTEAVPLLLPSVPLLSTGDLQTTSEKHPRRTATERSLDLENYAGKEVDILLDAFPATPSADDVDTLPELNGHASPSDSYVNSPSEDGPLTPPDPSVSARYVATPAPTRDYLIKTQTAPIANDFSAIASQLLQLCRFNKQRISLSEKKIRQVLEIHNCFVNYDILGSLYPILDPWLANIQDGLPGLGLPPVWKGIQGAVNYLRVLDTNKFPHPLAARFALIFFSLNYYELCKNPAKYCPLSEGRPDATSVLDCILAAYPDHPRISDNPQSRRNKITGFYAKRGNWWWVVGGTLGVGSWFVPDNLIKAMCSKSFNIGQVDALATLSLNTQPGTVRVFHSLEFVVKAIMLGQITDDLWQSWSNKRLIGRDELSRAHEEDQKALACLRTENRWTVADAKHYAEQKMTEFLAFLYES